VQPVNSTPQPAATPAPKAERLAVSVYQAAQEALKNDLQQARELAADYEFHLARKTNELAELRRESEAAFSELARLRGEVSELRHERLQLANEVARIAGLEFRLKRATEDKEILRNELQAAKAVRPVDLHKEPEAPVQFPTADANDPLSGTDRVYAKRLLLQLATQLDELRDLVDPDPARKPAPPKTPSEGQIIELSFGG
jgi:predicted RNase H-like nuclease (RuvC/YqgF family)